MKTTLCVDRSAVTRGTIAVIALALMLAMAGCEEAMLSTEDESDGPDRPAVPDTAPRFSATVADQRYTVAEAITPFVLPSARGGNGRLTYSLYPTPPAPGLTFDMGTHTFSGTPTTVGLYDVVYKVEDDDHNSMDSDSHSLTFTITIQELDCSNWNTNSFFSGATVDTVTACIQAGAHVNTSDSYGRTPLHFAAAHSGEPAIVTTLLSAGSALEARARFGERPLHDAASSNRNPEVISTLLNAGAVLEARDDNKRVPLHYAASYNENSAVITTFLNAGAALEVRGNHGWTPLHYAASSNDSPIIITTLLNAGALLDARGDFGRTPLHHAALSNHSEILTTLMDAGADVEARDNYGRSPLHLAAASNENTAAITTLLDAGAVLEARDDNGRTPLHGAALSNENSATITTLLNAGAELEARDYNGRTPLHYAASSKGNPVTIANIETLLYAGAELEARDDNGWAPLHHAAAYNYNPAVIVALVDAGAIVNAKDDLSRTPLDVAVDNMAEPSVIAALRAAGAECGKGLVFMNGMCEPEGGTLGKEGVLRTCSHGRASDSNIFNIDIVYAGNVDEWLKDEIECAAAYWENAIIGDVGEIYQAFDPAAGDDGTWYAPGGCRDYGAYIIGQQIDDVRIIVNLEQKRTPATAWACAERNDTGLPVYGRIGFAQDSERYEIPRFAAANPNVYVNMEFLNENLDFLYNLARHEIAHVLGFGSSTAFDRLTRDLLSSENLTTTESSNVRLFTGTVSYESLRK